MSGEKTNDQPVEKPAVVKPPTLFSSGHGHTVPAGTQSFGMALFLAALGMLFAGSLLVYWILRLRTGNDPVGLPLHSIRVPQTLLFSTPCMVAASYFIHRSLGAIRRGDDRFFRLFLSVGAVLSLLFVLLQVPALWALWERHHDAVAKHDELVRAGKIADEASGATTGSHAFYGSILFLIVTHAAHVLGGIIPLAVVVAKAAKGAYSREKHGAVRMLAWYWHFLDIVWLVMFATFLVLR